MLYVAYLKLFQSSKIIRKPPNRDPFTLKRKCQKSIFSVQCCHSLALSHCFCSQFYFILFGSKFTFLSQLLKNRSQVRLLFYDCQINFIFYLLRNFRIWWIINELWNNIFYSAYCVSEYTISNFNTVKKSMHYKIIFQWNNQ